MRINSNLTATTTNRMLTERYENMGRRMEKLSSGSRINRAGDDSAGLAISEKMRAQIRGFNKATQNIQDAINMINTAEGALNETHSILHRMRELSVQSSNSTHQDSDRELMQLEIDELIEELDRISRDTNYNTKDLIGNKDKVSNEFNFFVGANKDNIYGIVVNNMDSVSLGLEGFNLSSQKSANNGIKKLDEAIKKVSYERANIGATHNRLEHTLQKVRLQHDNLLNSKSRIRDADMAREITSYTADRIMMDTGVAVQIHSNTTAQGVLKLMGA